MTKCRECLRRRDCASVSRFGGGNYRRGGRQYYSSICEQCAVRLLGSLTPGGQNSMSRWDGMGLVRAVMAWSGWERERTEQFFYAISAERERLRQEQRDADLRPWSSDWYVDPWPLYEAAKQSS